MTQSGRPTQSTSAIEDSISINMILADATSALADIEGLTGNLLSTVMAQVASVISNIGGQGLIDSVISTASQTVSAAAATLADIIQPVITPVQSGAIGAIAGNGILRLKAPESGTGDITISVITMVVSPTPAPSDQNDVAALLSVFYDPKDKKRLVKRSHERTLEAILFCIDHAEHESCRDED